MKQEFIEYDGEKIYFYVLKKKIKNMYLKIYPDETITVSAPYNVSIKSIKKFVFKEAKWIKHKHEIYSKLPKHDKSSTYLLGQKYKINIIKGNRNEVIINNTNIEIYIKEKYIKDETYIEKYYEKWLREYAYAILEELTINYQQKLEIYNIQNPQIEIRKMKTKWGVCYPQKRKIAFSLNLIKTPMPCIEYVVLHEMAHFKYQNHSKDFYNFVALFMPNWKENKNILNKEFSMIV